MSFLPLASVRTHFLVFGRIKQPWWLRWTKGFNHVAIGWMIERGILVLIEPTFTGARQGWGHPKINARLAKELDAKIIEVEVVPSASQKLFGFKFQTCATLVQYLAGIDLGVYLAQSLHDKLLRLNSAQRKKYGITKVTVWEAAAVEAF